MSVPTTSWDETSPAGSDNVSAGDNRIREMKGQVREVVGTDHKFESSGQDADMGKHNKVSLLEQANLGTGAEGLPILGAQTVSGKAELVFTDEDDNDIQITSGGNIDLGSGNLDNDEYITATDNAGTGSVDVVKANTSDQVQIGAALLAAAGMVLPEITAPTTAANQGAVYTKNDGTQTELYFREESDGDEVQLTNDGALNTPGLQVATGTIDISSTGAVAETGVGFTPKAVLFLFGKTTAGQGGSSGFGIMTSSNQFSTESHADNANHGSGSSATAIVGRDGNGSPDIFSFDYTSMDADGFTVNVTDAVSSYNVMYIALG